jgi:hypothetical protein
MVSPIRRAISSISGGSKVAERPGELAETVGDELVEVARGRRVLVLVGGDLAEFPVGADPHAVELRDLLAHSHPRHQIRDPRVDPGVRPAPALGRRGHRRASRRVVGHRIAS